MNWDDFRFVLAVTKEGSLKRAGDVLGVEHTTVGRRVAATEAALGVALFTRTTQGLTLTRDAERLLSRMRRVEDAVHAVERNAHPNRDRLAGTVRITSPETFGVQYLAARMAMFQREHPALTIELVPAGEILDLGRRQAEIAVRMFRSKSENLVVRRVGRVFYGLYASVDYLARYPLKSREALTEHAILCAPGDEDIEPRWLAKLNPRATSNFVSSFSLALLEAAKKHAGVAILPRYIGDAEPSLQHVAMPSEPSEWVWLTVHQDLKQTPRVRAVLDFLAKTMKSDTEVLRGK